MNIKTLGLKLAGGLLAAAFVVTALAGNANPVAADLSCPSPCTVDTRPDLVVANFDVTVGPDGMVNVVFQVKNAGLSKAGQFETWFFYNGLWKYISNKWQGLPAGGEYSSTFSFMGHCGGPVEPS